MVMMAQLAKKKEMVQDIVLYYVSNESVSLSLNRQ